MSHWDQDWESLFKMATFGAAHGKTNIIADISALREAQSEIDRLRALNAELVASRAEPPRPAAIVVAGTLEFHAFADSDDARAWAKPRGDLRSMHRITDDGITWTWHPKA